MSIDYSAAFSIDPEWITADSGLEEARKTSAFLRIIFNNRIATRADDDWSKTVRESVRVSAYPLALWFASSWWRLRWEPAPGGRRSVEWRMAHETAAAGYGYIWPRITFESDDESVEAICRPSSFNVTEPIRYLADFNASISARSFELVVDDFIGLVLARLNAVGLRDTELHQLWRTLEQERANCEIARIRMLEARLGFDPDEAPSDTINELQSLYSTAGAAAVAEIAPAITSMDQKATLAEVIKFARSEGIRGKIVSPSILMHGHLNEPYRHAPPWERGWALGRNARHAWKISDDRVSDEAISEILSVKKSKLSDGMTSPKSSIGFAVRMNGSGELKFLFRKRNRFARRFEAARFVAEQVLAPDDDRWLPETDTKTARQKVQRAFAAEFLCPIDKLRDYLHGELSNEAIEDAGEHFEVSPLAIRSHLANHGLLSVEAVSL